MTLLYPITIGLGDDNWSIWQPYVGSNIIGNQIIANLSVVNFPICSNGIIINGLLYNNFRTFENVTPEILYWNVC